MKKIDINLKNNKIMNNAQKHYLIKTGRQHLILSALGLVFLGYGLVVNNRTMMPIGASIAGANLVVVAKIGKTLKQE